MMRLAILFAVACAFAVAFGAGRAEPTGACGTAGPFEFNTYEYEHYTTDYGQAIQLATEGKAGLAPYTLTNGDVVDLNYQGLESGPRAARTGASPERLVPPSVYKSIVFIESNWANAAGTVPYGGVGPILRSFDCGYGLGQVTTGMTNNTGTPTGRQAAIGTHVLFNLAEGVRILADKWNTAPSFRPVAGTGEPAIVEDWYYAIWSYNGFAFSNHPLSPSRDPLRGGSAPSPIYHCFNPSAPSYTDAGGFPLFGYGDYTYPERVYGCMAYPPVRNGASLWSPQELVMPNFADATVAAAFTPSHFLDCEDAGFSGGCPAMDFPTNIPESGMIPHVDPTPSADPSWLGKFLGDPVFQYSGPDEIVLVAKTDGTATSGVVTVSNVGAGVGPFRVRTSQPWIIVRHTTDPPSRAIDGGVAVASSTEVVVQSNPRVAVAGYDAHLLITIHPDIMPSGIVQGEVFIEPLLGSGGVYRIGIIAAKGASSLPFRNHQPSVSTD